MPVKLCFALLCCLFFSSGGCDSDRTSTKNSTPANTPPTAAASSPNQAGGGNETNSASGANMETPAASALGACGLIEKSEIETAQAAKVKGTVPSRRDGDGLLISQCYYTAFSSDGSKDLSVHLEVTQSDPKGANPNAVGDLWREKFQGAMGTKKMEKPKPVTGVGDGAYWVGNNKAGALYVLKKDKLVRISIGGPDDEETKIKKTQVLAEKVLKRID